MVTRPAPVVRPAALIADHWPLVILVGTLAITSLTIAALPLSIVVLGAIGLAVLIGALVEPGIGLIVTLLVGPWAAWMNTYTPGLLPIDAGQIMVGLTLTAWGLGGLARRNFIFPRSPILIPLLIFVGWAAVTMLWAPDLTFGLPEVLKWIEINFIMLFSIDLARRRGLRWIVAAVLLAVTLQAVLGIYQAQWRGIGPLGFRLSEGIYRAYGTFEQPNPFAGFIGLGLPIAVALTTYCVLRIAHQALRNPKNVIRRYAMPLVVYASVTGLLAAALYLSFSRGAWLGAVAAIGAMIACAPRRVWIGVGLVAATLALVVGLSNAGLLPASINERLADAGDILQFRDVRGVPINDANYALIERQAHWQAALNMLTAYPWTGVGFSNYQPVYEQYRLLNWPMPLGHAHNIYLNVAAETGLPGLAAYLGLWAAIFGVTFQTIRRTRGIDRAITIGLMGTWTHLSVHMLVDNLYVNNTHLTIGALLGLLAVIYSNALQQPTSSFQLPTSNSQQT